MGGFGGGEERGVKGVTALAAAALAIGGGIAPAGHCRRTTGGALGLPALSGRGSPLELDCRILASEPVDDRGELDMPFGFGLGAAYCRPKAAAMARNWSGGSSCRKDSGPKGALCCSARTTSSTPAGVTGSDLDVERGVRGVMELSSDAPSATTRPELKTVSGLA